MISITLRCLPPSVTAQRKRLSVTSGRPVFFHDHRMEREAHTWATLLQAHRPPVPMAGAVELVIRLIYPHLKKTAKRDQGALRPKVSKPDAGNAAKHLEDTLVRMRFLEDDQQVARLTVEKWHGPSDQVGIRIDIRSWPGEG